MFPAAPVAFWHYFDFITISLLTIVLAALLTLHHRKMGDLLGSISQTVAHSKTTNIVFSVAMTILFPLYYAFVWFWVLPLIRAPRGFYYLLVFAALCEVVFVWVPATTGKSKRIHGIMATMVSVVMFLLALLILIHGVHISALSRTGLSVFLLSPFAVLAVMTVKDLRKYTLLYEIIISITFLAAISLVGHT